MNKYLLIFCSAILFFICSCTQKESKKINMKTNSVLVDVRTMEEYQTSFLKGAINIPYDEIEKVISNYVTQKSTPIYVYCRSGRRSAIAVEKLKNIGFSNINDLGGFNDAQKSLNLPVVTKLD